MSIEIISLHVPKTAGTFFFHILNQVYGAEKVVRDYVGHTSIKEQIPGNIPEELKVVHGHFSLDKYKNYYPEAKRITWVRHPLFRFISFYLFWATQLYKGEGDPFSQKSILDMAQEVYKTQTMSAFFKETDIQQFAFVGVQEFLEDELYELGKILDWDHNFLSSITPSEQKINVSKFKEYDSFVDNLFHDTTLLKALCKILEEDFRLYESALKLREDRTSDSLDFQQCFSNWKCLARN